jgi:hypothetical protein
LAELIAARGDSCEQETTRQRVMPQLPAMLTAIENGEPPTFDADFAG